MDNLDEIANSSTGARWTRPGVGARFDDASVRIDLSVQEPDGTVRDIAIQARERVPFFAVHTFLDQCAPGAADRPWCSAGRHVSDAAALGEAGLRSGAVLRRGEPWADRRHRSTPILDVVGGPDAGKHARLVPGTLVLGRDRGCDLVLTDPDVSRRHLAVITSPSGVTVRDLASTNGTTVDGEALASEPRSLTGAELIRLGSTFLSLADADERMAATGDDPDGTTRVVRQPHRVARPVPTVVPIPTRPTSARARKVQWLAAAVPAAIGGALAVSLHSVQLLAFALVAPLGMLAGDAVDWLRIRRASARNAARHRSRVARFRTEVAARLRSEQTARRGADPDPGTVMRIAAGPLARLWERARDDPDLLRVRIGLGTVRSAVEVSGQDGPVPAGALTAVPVAVDLRTGPVTITLPRAAGQQLAFWLVAQLATLVSPADLELAIVVSRRTEGAWQWARWLPHLRRATGGATWTPQELSTLVDARQAAARRVGEGRRGSADRLQPPPWLVAIVDLGEDAETAALAAVLVNGTAHGVSAIVVEPRPLRPVGSGVRLAAVHETASAVAVAVEQTDGGAVEPNPEAICDQVDPEWVDHLARALAPLRDGSSAAAGLPRTVPLAGLIAFSPSDPAAIRTAWRHSGGRADVMIGMAEAGPLRLDLDRDGPHALLAGTTGSGKSEALRTLVLGLAIAHPPDEIAFVLIDYKGGAAFADCTRLPHVAAAVSDLDEDLAGRALRSLAAEIRRRERLFADVGARDLAGYRYLRGASSLPRLVIVVDEFAVLTTELPDFVTGLVGVARRGRSLGLHLVLATQRPAGVVSAEIRANASLRIALRVTDPADSHDVIDDDAAADIVADRPGRAYVRTASGTVAVQLATASARYEAPAEVTVTELGPWRSLPPNRASSSDPTGPAGIVTALRDAARAEGCGEARAPWVQPLPSSISTPCLPVVNDPALVPIGLVDRVHAQDQPPLVVDLGVGGSLLVVGTARSGRTSALVTLATGAAARLSPEDLHVHAIDCAGHNLAALGALPHHGTTAGPDDGLSTADELITRVLDEQRHRRRLLTELGVDSIADARRRGHRLPLLLILLDGWETFTATADGSDRTACVERLLAAVRDAPGTGVTVAAAGDRGALAPRIGSVFATRVILRLTDRVDYAAAGIASGAVPGHLPPGRGLLAPDGLEIQCAHPGPDPGAAGVASAVQTCAARWAARSPSGVAPLRLLPLPERVSLAAVARPADRIVVGVAAPDNAVVSLDLLAMPSRLLVAGPAHSGRSTTLMTLLAQTGAGEVVVAASARSPLADAAHRRGCTLIGPDDPCDAVPSPAARRRLFLVDDGDTFAATPVGQRIESLLRADPPEWGFVVSATIEDAVTAYRGLVTEIRRHRCGLLLRPASADGDALGVRLPRQRDLAPPGRGLLIGDPRWGPQFAHGPLTVQVALP